jgi:hypothetical protein
MFLYFLSFKENTVDVFYRKLHPVCVNLTEISQISVTENQWQQYTSLVFFIIVLLYVSVLTSHHSVDNQYINHTKYCFQQLMISKKQ